MKLREERAEETSVGRSESSSGALSSTSAILSVFLSYDFCAKTVNYLGITALGVGAKNISE